MQKLNLIKILDFFSAIRVSHYVKNCIIFIPSFFNLGISINYPDLLITFVSLCFAASAGYLFNDKNDIKFDKKNYLKKNRILASNKISLQSAKTITIILIILSLLLSIIVSKEIFYFIFLYIISSFIYTLLIKKIIYLDILFLSFFYIYRILLGVFISNQDITIWLILLSFIFFLNFSSIKRLIDTNNYISKYKSQIYNSSSIYILKNLIKILTIILPIISFIYLFLDSFIFTKIEIGIFMIIIISSWNFYITNLAFKKKIKKDFITFMLTDVTSQIVFLFSIILLILNIYLSF